MLRWPVCGPYAAYWAWGCEPFTMYWSPRCWLVADVIGVTCACGVDSDLEPMAKNTEAMKVIIDDIKHKTKEEPTVSPPVNSATYFTKNTITETSIDTPRKTNKHAGLIYSIGQRRTLHNGIK